MSIIYGKPLMGGGGKKPISLDVSKNGTWSRDGGYNPVNVNVPASAVTSGSLIIAANGNYDITKYKTVVIAVGETMVTTEPASGISYINGLPSDWGIMKEVAKAISNESDYINSDTTGAVYVNKGNSWAYKITPGDTITLLTTSSEYEYALMGFNNYELTNKANYGGNNTYAGLTFGMVNPIGGESYQMNNTATTEWGWGKCFMKTSTMQTLKTEMPSTVITNMAKIKIPYYERNASSVLYSDDYMFLPAEKEVFGYQGHSFLEEADALTQYAYYRDSGSTIEPDWWLRSIDVLESGSFCCVDSDGNMGSASADAYLTISPCFCV